MPVNYTPPTPEQLLPVAGVALGHRRRRASRTGRATMSCWSVSMPGSRGRGRVHAEPVLRRAGDRLPRAPGERSGSRARCVINAGNANAGTGAARSRRCARHAAPPWRRASDCAGREVLPFSTGVIMEPLPVDRIVGGAAEVRGRAVALRDGDAAVRAIMTTDTVPKGASSPRRHRRRARHRHRHRQGRRA